MRNSGYDHRVPDLFARLFSTKMLSGYTGEACGQGNAVVEKSDSLVLGRLPDDEEELFAGLVDDLDKQAQAMVMEEADEFDLFSSGGGLELESDLGEEGSRVGIRYGVIDPLQFEGGGCSTTGVGEHPLGEHPSRTLFVRNINSSVEDSELRKLFEQYGVIRTLYTACKHRGFVMISYYDIRAARSAMRGLQNKPLRRRKLDIHFSIPKENPSDKDVNQGTLVVFNLDLSVSNEDLRHIFGVYGEIKEIRETPHKRHHKFIEYYDVRAAEAALRSLNRSDIAGKRIKLEPSRPGGTRKSLMQAWSVGPIDTDDLRNWERTMSPSLQASSPFKSQASWQLLEAEPEGSPARQLMYPSQSSASLRKCLSESSGSGLSMLGGHMRSPSMTSLQGILHAGGGDSSIGLSRQPQFQQQGQAQAQGSPRAPGPTLLSCSPSSQLRPAFVNPLTSLPGRSLHHQSLPEIGLGLGSYSQPLGYSNLHGNDSRGNGSGPDGDGKQGGHDLPRTYSDTSFSASFSDLTFEHNHSGSAGLSFKSHNYLSGNSLSSFSSSSASSYSWNVPGPVVNHQDGVTGGRTSSAPPVGRAPSYDQLTSAVTQPWGSLRNSNRVGASHLYASAAMKDVRSSFQSLHVGSDPLLLGRSFSLLGESDDAYNSEPCGAMSGSRGAVQLRRDLHDVPSLRDGSAAWANFGARDMGYDYVQDKLHAFASKSSSVGQPMGWGPAGSMLGSGHSLQQQLEKVKRRSDGVHTADIKRHFVLDPDRILRSEDQRTTLMLRNIPNKYTQKMLLHSIDEYHQGTYDFFYLPIDFKNKCNVGYAFINMISPTKILPFYQDFNGKRWEKFNSEKVASLAYARIQGKVALVAHFQNSSLMNEDKRCRPILFHTDGPHHGIQGSTCDLSLVVNEGALQACR
eukprot:jgi/Mesen1/4150/ME000218S03264